jgi:twitching motility protein PilI
VVPLTRPWFRGVANVRGNLYSVIDFAEFLGTGVSGTGEHARLVLLGERFRSAAGLLIDRSLGLRNPQQLRAREPAPGRKSWLRGEYEDESGARWSELDVGELVRDAEFLSVAT